MLSTLLTLTLLQPPPTPTTGSSSGGGGSAPMGCADTNFLLMMGFFFIVMYFMLIRPQQKRDKQHKTMLGALKKGDVVRTDSGIRGEIVTIDEREVALLVAEKTKINILRSRIAGLDAAPETSEKK